MSSISPPVISRPSITATSFVRFSELVKQIGTSPARSLWKQKKSARKKLKRIINEQQTYSKKSKLRAVALTLTYGCAKVFSSKHISAFLDNLRRTLKRLGHRFPYVWVLECAGQLHSHLMLWLPRSYRLDPVRLEKWWPWGSTWMENCRSVKAWGRYMAKFDSIAKLPKGARVYGYGGLDSEGKVAVARAALPRWLLALLPVGHNASRCRGGGWMEKTTGEIYRSPYIWTPRGAILVAAL